MRYDLITPRARKDGKTFWVKLGAGFPNKDGQGFTLVLDALPVADAEGIVRVLMVEPRDNAGQQRQEQPAARDNLDTDEIPF